MPISAMNEGQDVPAFTPKTERASKNDAPIGRDVPQDHNARRDQYLSLLSKKIEPTDLPQ